MIYATMPASIIEDSSLLKPPARILCIALFFLGVIMLIAGVSYIGKGIELLKNHGAKHRVTIIADSIPEEMTFVLPPVTSPKTREDKILRTGQIENTMNLLTQEINNSPMLKTYAGGVKNPKTVIATGVISGLIHPKEAQRMLKEVEILEVTMNQSGSWESPLDLPQNKENY